MKREGEDDDVRHIRRLLILVILSVLAVPAAAQSGRIPLLREQGDTRQLIVDGRPFLILDGTWRPGRRLNGDESHQGRHLRLPPGRFGIQRLRLYRYR